MQKQEQESELFTTGIFNKRSYADSGVFSPGLTGVTDVNGSGMRSLGSQTVGNNTMKSPGLFPGI